MRKTLLTGLATLAFTVLNAEVGLHFSGEFLWWKVVPNNQSLDIRSTISLSNPNVATRENLYYTYGWDPGYKVGIDYSLCLDNRNIDLFATWAHFNASESKSIDRVNTGSTSLISAAGFSVFTSSPGVPVVYEGHADFSFNRLDTGIAANYFQCNNLTINPSCAFTYVNIKNSISEVGSVPGVANNSNVHFTFNGYGTTIGANAHYSLTHGFFIYGLADLSALYGQYNCTENNLNLGTTTIYNQKNWNMRFIADFNVGVEYFVCLFDCMQLSARVGYEFVYLPDMNVIGQIATNAAFDAFTINGLVAGLQLGF